MIRPIMYLVALPVLTIYHGLKAIVPGYLRVPYRPGGVYDQAGRGWAKGLIRAAGVKVTTVGLERVPIDRSVVYVSNHQSLFDILALAATVPGTMRFVAKKEFLRIPILGRAMKSAGQIFIDRKNLAKAFEAYEEAAQAVRDGLNAVVFAEGTRSHTGELQPFKKGPFVFAIASQVPVIPVYCAGTFDVLRKGSLWVRPGPVTVYFGEPIPTSGMTYEDRGALLERTREVIMGFRVDAGEEER
jgi:1-acyl-sn-glycerol-3-phosphate acyltransferase